MTFSVLSQRQRSVRFVVVLLTCNLHVVRNIPGLAPIYLGMWALVGCVALADFARAQAGSRSLGRFHVAVLVAWTLAGLIGLASSLTLITSAGSFYGLARFWFGLPVFLALCAYVEDREDLVRYTRWCVVFFTLAVLTIPLQVVVGPIEWFHDASERGGLARYPSLLGGLNSAGGAVGAYMLLSYSLPPRARWLAIGAMSLCVAVDLSKSGIVSIGVALMLLLYLHRSQLKQVLLGYSAFVGVAVAAFLFIPFVAARIGTSLLSFGIVTDAALRNSDKSVLESGNDRLTELPLDNLAVWLSMGQDPLGLLWARLFGGGFGMASTALVPEGDSLAPMSHNQWVEMLTVFGIVGSAFLVAVVLRAVWRLSIRKIDIDLPPEMRVMFLMTLLLLLGRFVLANGGLYHPASVTPLFLCLFAAGFTAARSQSPEQITVRLTNAKERQP